MLMQDGVYTTLTWSPLHTIPFQPPGYVAPIATFLIFAKYKRRRDPVTSFFSRISYPLCVVHAALGYTLIAVCLNHRWRPEFALGAVFVTTIAFADVLHRRIEAPLHRLVQRIATRWTIETEQMPKSAIRSS